MRKQLSLEFLNRGMQIKDNHKLYEYIFKDADNNKFAYITYRDLTFKKNDNIKLLANLVPTMYGNTIVFNTLQQVSFL